MVVPVVRSVVVPTIVAIAVILALISISYPSVVVSNVTTQPSSIFETYTSQYQVGYPQAVVSTVLAGYSTVTAWYPGNPICDPTSNACTPYPTPTATFVYPQSVTYAYQVTSSSQATSAFTSEFTTFSTQTSYQNIPPYAVVGLTEFQYGIIALVIIAAVVLSLLIFFGKKSVPSHVQSAGSSKAVRFCQRCGTKNPGTGKFCKLRSPAGVIT